MTDDVDAKLDAIFNAKLERETEAVRKQREVEHKRAAALQEFLLLKESLIRPTLELMVSKLKGRGISSEIYEVADGDKVGGKVRRATIGIRFYPEGGGPSYRQGADFPHLSLTVDPDGRRIEYFSSTMSPGRGGTAGADGVVNFEELTVDRLNNKVLGIIAVVFK